MIDDLATTSKRSLGQVIEWLVWSAAVGFAETITHVFLPLDDRGVDGIVRRPADDAMCAVQVKGRSALFRGELQVVLRAAALDDANVTVVVPLFDPATMTLGTTVFVMDAPTVLTRGTHSAKRGMPVVELAIPYGDARGTRWQPYACELSRLSERLLGPLRTAAAPGTEDETSPASATRADPIAPLRPGTRISSVTSPSSR